jgi:hypothetical protein
MNLEKSTVFLRFQNETSKKGGDRYLPHDIQLNELYEAMENLLEERISKQKWEDRERIGFGN